MIDDGFRSVLNLQRVLAVSRALLAAAVLLAGEGCGTGGASNSAPEAGLPTGPDGASDSCAQGPSTTPGPAFTGDLVIATTADADAARGYSEITGRLTIAPSFAGPLDLPNLTKVGAFYSESKTTAPDIEPANITRLSLPNLTAVGETLWMVYNPALTFVDLRRLETVGGRFWIYRNPKLVELRMEKIQAVGQDIHMQNNAFPDCMVTALKALFAAAGLTSDASGIPGQPACPCQVVCGELSYQCSDGGR